MNSINFLNWQIFVKENTNTILRKRVALTVIRAQNSDGKFNAMEGLKIMYHHYLN